MNVNAAVLKDSIRQAIETAQCAGDYEALSAIRATLKEAYCDIDSFIRFCSLDNPADTWQAPRL